MPRKTPVRHHVVSHRRNKSNVAKYNRGRGQMSVTEMKAREGTIDAHKRKLYKIGDAISYLDNNKRVTGVVVGIRQEYYLVERNSKIWRVDRHSVFTRIGSALGSAGAKLLTAGKAGLAATVARAKALDGVRMKAALAKGAEAVKRTGVKGAARISAELERRRDERANWKAWKKEMEREEKQVLRYEQGKIRKESERQKYRENIRRGPLWKRALASTGSLLKTKSTTKRKTKRKVRKLKTKKAKTKKIKTVKPKSKEINVKKIRQIGSGTNRTEVWMVGDRKITLDFSEWSNNTPQEKIRRRNQLLADAKKEFSYSIS